MTVQVYRTRLSVYVVKPEYNMLQVLYLIDPYAYGKRIGRSPLIKRIGDEYTCFDADQKLMEFEL